MNRRAVMAGLGGTLLASTALGGARAHQVGLVVRDEGPFGPWAEAARLRPGDPRGLVAAAILSSNPHNTQAWTFRLTDGAVEVAADTDRHLGSFDPFRREMWLGLGASVETMAIMAPGLGFRLGAPRVLDLGADGAGRVVMELQGAPATPHPLAAAIPRRRTNRGAYAAQPVGAARLAALRAEAEGPARVVLADRSTPEGEALAAATLEATAAINADPRMVEDGHRWFRPNARAIAEARDGVSVATAGLPPLMAILAQMLPPADTATAGRYWHESTARAMAASAGFGLITVPDLDDRAGQIAAGRLWQRLQLTMSAAGLASQPVNQLPEMVDRDRELGRDGGWGARVAAAVAALGGTGRATFAFRFGRPLVEVPHSARRPVEAVLREA